jgi:hypothetical protein
MNLAMTIDLRGYDFVTMREFMLIVMELVPAIKEDYPQVQICGVVISERHLKMLRLERYEQGEPLHVVKKIAPEKVCGIPVIIAAENGQVHCPGCGGVHEQGETWYGER